MPAACAVQDRILCHRGMSYRFIAPPLSRFPLPPGEGQGEGGRTRSSGWASLTPALSQWERGQEVSSGALAANSDAQPISGREAPPWEATESRARAVDASEI